jgi:hypothetical protein
MPHPQPPNPGPSSFDCPARYARLACLDLPGFLVRDRKSHSTCVHDTVNVVKILSSLALLGPIAHSSHPSNTVGWGLATIAAVLHHSFPNSKTAHDGDHWGIAVALFLVMYFKFGVFNGGMLLYLCAFLIFFFHHNARLAVAAVGILWMVIIFSDAQVIAVGLACLVTFAMQRKEAFPHCHSLWHLLMAYLGYLITRPPNMIHTML